MVRQPAMRRANLGITDLSISGDCWPPCEQEKPNEIRDRAIILCGRYGSLSLQETVLFSAGPEVSNARGRAYKLIRRLFNRQVSGTKSEHVANITGRKHFRGAPFGLLWLCCSQATIREICERMQRPNRGQGQGPRSKSPLRRKPRAFSSRFVGLRPIGTAEERTAEAGAFHTFSSAGPPLLQAVASSGNPQTSLGEKVRQVLGQSPAAAAGAEPVAPAARDPGVRSQESPGRVAIAA
jgi:hypothetical protein